MTRNAALGGFSCQVLVLELSQQMGLLIFIAWATRIAVTIQPQLKVRLFVHQGTP